MYINLLWASANSCVAKLSLQPHTLMASLSPCVWLALHQNLFTTTQSQAASPRGKRAQVLSPGSGVSHGFWSHVRVYISVCAGGCVCGQPGH